MTFNINTNCTAPGSVQHHGDYKNYSQVGSRKL